MTSQRRLVRLLAGDRLFWAGGGIAVLAGVGLALSRAWVCDDAFISFRYAVNLVRGHGLVYNAGERVEGYTNFLWTLAMVPGVWLGVDLERWSVVWGLLFYATTLALLVGYGHRRSRDLARPALPIAALVGAACVDWANYATSGLETSLFTCLVLAGFLALSSERPGTWTLPAAGATFALAALTRPEGVLVFAVGLGFVLWCQRPLARALLRYAAAFAVLWIPPTAWRIWYYGDYVPNTYYAKSAYLAWYEQGFHYLALYVRGYWPLALGAVLGIAALVIRLRDAPGGGPAWRIVDGARLDATARRLALALALTISYTLYLARVGGDFMYARMLIPVTPLLLVLLEEGLAGLLVPRPWTRLGVTAAVILALVVTPRPVTGRQWVHGVADEWDYYVNVRKTWAAENREHGRILHRYFAGLPVGIAFGGSEAGFVYYADPAVAVESATGLTDATIAHQALAVRGRPGHEKLASLDYLVRVRRLHFLFNRSLSQRLLVDKALPNMPVDFDGVWGWMLRWDPEVMAALAARGARFPDVPALIDQYVARLSEADDASVSDAYRRLKTFYFDHVADEAREAPFLARIAPRPSRP